jgi:molybdopterin synthase catalytic subunit
LHEGLRPLLRRVPGADRPRRGGARAAGRRARPATRSTRWRRATRAITALRGKFRAAVNQDFTDEDRELADGDELALIPPVAGGAADVAASSPSRCRSIACVAAVAGPGRAASSRSPAPCAARATAHASITSSTRRTARWPAKVMRALSPRSRPSSPARGLAVEHRTGTLAVGENRGRDRRRGRPHGRRRSPACRAMIDRLKDRVPIWKKEFGDDGAVWVGLGP